MDTDNPSWWLNAPPDNFTSFASVQLNAPVKVDDAHLRIEVQRQQLLSALIGLRENRPTSGVRHANVVSNH